MGGRKIKPFPDRCVCGRERFSGYWMVHGLARMAVCSACCVRALDINRITGKGRNDVIAFVRGRWWGFVQEKR